MMVTKTKRKSINNPKSLCKFPNECWDSQRMKDLLICTTNAGMTRLTKIEKMEIVAKEEKSNSSRKKKERERRRRPGADESAKLQ